MRSGLALVCALYLCACGGRVTIDAAVGSGGAGATATGSTTAASGGAGGDASPFAACDGPGQCTLAVPGCCGVCGVPELDAFEAIHASQGEAFHAATCTDPSQCVDDCIQYENGSLFAACRSGACTGYDLSEHPYGACTDSSQCTLRWGAGCCEHCGPTPSVLTALNPAHVAELLADVCAPDAGCPPCAPPPYPFGAAAVCIGGQCIAVVGD